MKLRKKNSFGNFAKHVESILLRLVVLGLATIVFFQILLTNAEIRKMLSYSDDLEGEKFEDSIPVFNAQSEIRERTGTITIALADGRPRYEAELLINGYVVGNFSEPEITVTVYDGDQLEINYPLRQEELRFIIKAASTNVIFPNIEQEFFAKTDKFILGEVELRE